jgi:transcriptional regulator with XRE-family HTH domain
MADPIDLHLGRRLRWRRRAAGLTQGELGAALGLRFQQIHKYECGANRMSATLLWRLACALGVEVDYFYEGLIREARSGPITAAATDEWSATG